MNQTEAESVKDLAKPTVEALGVITEKECPECKGTGDVDLKTKKLEIMGSIRCRKCNGTGKLSWRWKSEVGEFVIRETLKEICLITYVCAFDILRVTAEDGASFDESKKRFTPLLPWEEIERVLEGVGYEMDLLHTSYRNCKEEHNIEICRKGESDPSVWNCKGKTRQEAVMRSVIELGKELDAKSK